MKKKNKKPVGKKKIKAKKTLRKTAGKKTKPVKKIAKAEKPIGRVTHYYTALRVMLAKFKQPLRVGTSVHLKGATTDYVQAIDSMQFDHKPIRAAKKNQLVGIKAKKRVREGDLIYKA